MLRRDLCDHAGEFSLEINVVKLGQHQYAPEAVCQFVAEFPFGVGDRPSAVLRHGEFYEVADIADEPRHDFIARPGAPAGGEGGGVETGAQGHSLIGESVEVQEIGWWHDGRGEMKINLWSGRSIGEYLISCPLLRCAVNAAINSE